jgi:hypothetical protein
MDDKLDDLFPLEVSMPAPVDIPPELVLGIATGLEEPKDIAYRHGIVGAQWEALQKWKPFLDAVAKQRAELEANGFTFRLKAKLLTEDVFDEAYKIAKNNESTLMQKLEFIKLGAKLADMEPKQSAQVAAGPGFSISINFSGAPPEKRVVDVTPEKIQDTEAE